MTSRGEESARWGSDEHKVHSAVGVVGAADVLLGGERLNVDEEATLGVSRAVVVGGVVILSGVLDDGGECGTVLGDSHFPVHVESLPGGHAGVVDIVEGYDGGVLDLGEREGLTVGELASPLAAAVLGALLLVGSVGVIAASGVGLVPGELGGLGEGGDDEGCSEDQLGDHIGRDFY